LQKYDNFNKYYEKNIKKEKTSSIKVIKKNIHWNRLK
jgi:hypothetical protein